MGYSVAFMLPRAIPAMPSGGVAIGCPLVPAAGVAGIGRVALFTDPAGTFVFSDRVAIPAASNYGTTVRTVNGAVGATYAANRMVAGAPSTTAAGVVRIF